jgi:S1-C subfamily serine protease
VKKQITTMKIKHLNGEKNNQVEEFDYKTNKTITFGRSSESQVQFGSDKDNGVSRNHGVISRGETSGSFTITDNNSLNGTYVNGEKVTGTRELFPGDIISLGAKGPSFEFDTNPRWLDQDATQLIPMVDVYDTVEHSIKDSDTPTKQGIGKETFEHAIVVERKKSQKTLFSAMAAVVMVLMTLGFSFKNQLFVEGDPTMCPPMDTTVVISTTTVIDDAFSPEKIAKENSDKVVFIEFGYKLTHAPTGDDIYHQYTRQKDEKTNQEYLVPLYIEMQPGVIEPLLGLKKDVVDGVPIAASMLSGTGFVVDEDGYILTNKHIAEPWQYPYHFPQQTGLLYQQVQGEWKITGEVNAPYNWRPSETKFFGREPISGQIISGKSTYMHVTFAKTESRINARVVQSSTNHDVAMLKIDHRANFSPVELKETGEEVAQGAKIAVMGYPGVSPNVVYARATQEFGKNQPTSVKVVPDPTITDGTIGKIIRGSNMKDNADMDFYHSTFGEYYQLTASETGAGNSGGPVFDKEGKVVGIFAASRTSRAGTRLTFAIPIKYGLELMHLTKVIQ